MYHFLNFDFESNTAPNLTHKMRAEILQLKKVSQDYTNNQSWKNYIEQRVQKDMSGVWICDHSAFRSPAMTTRSTLSEFNNQFTQPASRFLNFNSI